MTKLFLLVREVLLGGKMPEFDDKIMLGIFTALESAHAYSAYLPSMFTIRTFGGDPDTVRDIRQGEMLGTAFSLVLGIVVSKLVKSPFPFFAAIVVSGAMVGVYEYALRTPHASTVDE